jgi:hypothetical protein
MSSDMPRYLLFILAVALTFPAALQAADPSIVRVEISSTWGGLGMPQKTELVIENENGDYHLGSTRIEPALVESLQSSIREPVQGKPTLDNLGITEEWLKTAEDKLEKDAEQDDGDSMLYKLGQGSPDQKAIFRRSYADREFVAKVLPNLFCCRHTDDNPNVRVTIVYADGSRTILCSYSQSEFMLPWKIEGGTGNMKTFNKNISVAVAAMMPDKATNRERVSGSGMDLALGWTVMDALANEWNLSNARAQAGEALDKIGNVYQILSADVNPYHDVTFGVYVEDKPDEREENLHLDLKRPDFPQGFTLTAILLCNDRKVFGVDQFLQDVPRYQDLTLSVPWLAKLRTKCPKCGTTLIWVHNQSLSDKALKNFTADMHAVKKDALANEVRQVQSQVAVLNVSYGDWWLVLPDRRTILWRYESVSGLLGHKKSEFSVHECTDYQGVSGGCVGAVFSPDGERIN